MARPERDINRMAHPRAEAPERATPILNNWRLKVWLALAVTLWFSVVYLLCDYLTHDVQDLRSVKLAFEDAIPFLPSFASVYISFSLLVCLPLLLIDSASRLVALALSLAIEITLAGVAFLAFPVEPSAPPPGDHGAIFEFIDLVNLKYNSLPSLHVALAISVGLAVQGDISTHKRAAIWVWIALIVGSTLLTKQHFAADIIAGCALAFFAMLGVYPGMQRITAGWLPSKVL
jgi:membrane-associated phospholipid phosphatase